MDKALITTEIPKALQTYLEDKFLDIEVGDYIFHKDMDYHSPSEYFEVTGFLPEIKNEHSASIVAVFTEDVKQDDGTIKEETRIRRLSGKDYQEYYFRVRTDDIEKYLKECEEVVDGKRPVLSIDENPPKEEAGTGLALISKERVELDYKGSYQKYQALDGKRRIMEGIMKKRMRDAKNTLAKKLEELNAVLAPLKKKIKRLQTP